MEALWTGTVEKVTAGTPPVYAVSVPRLGSGGPITGVEALATTGGAYAVGDRVLVGFLTRSGPVVIIGRYQ